MNTPNWAQDLIIDAMLYLESKGFQSNLPDIKWRHRTGFHSSGHAGGHAGATHITISAGTNRTDQKLVLLHELAHMVTKPEIKYLDIERAKKKGWRFPSEFLANNGGRPLISKYIYHTAEFWDTAWDLYRWAELSVRYCLNREKEYRVGAVAAYRRSK